jgi:pimeloyl-ACP methyl ester carboxylesterase
MTSHSINYVELGDPSRPALLLVHGFGASSYHWRHNIPTLARDYHVYALDLLGFGWSDKPIMDYDASVWRDQVVDFVREVILSGIAGNSLGGFTAMYASSDDRSRNGSGAAHSSTPRDASATRRRRRSRRKSGPIQSRGT